MSLKILFIINTLTGGGAERVVSELSQNFPESVDSHLLVNSISEKDYPFRGEKFSLGFKADANKTLFYHMRAAIKRYFVLRKAKQSNRYNLYISFMESANFLNILTSNANSNEIISVRVAISQDKNWKSKLILRHLMKKMYTHAKKIITVSEDIENDLVENFGIDKHKIATIYNGCNVQRIKRLMAEPLPFIKDENCFYFVTIGRLTVQKAQWHLLRSFSQLSYQNNAVRLIIIGEGDYEKKLKNYAKDLNIYDRVIFTGRLDNPYAVLSKCDAYVMTSLFEGMSNTILEAMACNLPVISTDHISGAREVLDASSHHCKETITDIFYAKYGIIVPLLSELWSDPDASPQKEEKILCKAMEKIYMDAELRNHYKTKSTNRIQDFTYDKITKQWLSNC